MSESQNGCFVGSQLSLGADYIIVSFDETPGAIWDLLRGLLIP